MIELKCPGRKIYPSLLKTVLEKVEKLSFDQRNGLLNCFVGLLKLKLCVKTPLNKNIFETFNLRICPLVVCP